MDEAGLLPERTLLWHYRSRHEHLIAFSNTKIYKNNLITFPANIDRVPNNGVEYIYVAEGIYDRGGKNGNVIEAKRVAELTFDRKGYKLGTQVGCSGYRIDMAVKHPSISGLYVIGIECDGAAYHSARTARERDRLRQTVLEDMGWKIYRIWSTDWIKDPVTEGEKLIEAVENAINGYVEESDENHELSEAMLVIISNSYGIMKDSLFQTTTREYGFARLGERIQTALQQAYNLLLKSGRVKELEGKVVAT
ncbi:DUF559 domain-containing protein [Herbivorax sp. ANBcel31]|uniref:DUF559 domain-containing protein n=1 Tax=Herbivorax sp. ANBcel31 TaxID=3069754 RepID=UPI0027B4008B|nr:DUF559 domain-containing protein [Herbivorax sp. ANBcel31]MDQ2086923.1 DUF559 domain-containing protein [Herbivorax sp. ANBcel31]